MIKPQPDAKICPSGAIYSDDQSGPATQNGMLNRI